MPEKLKAENSGHDRCKQRKGTSKDGRGPTAPRGIIVVHMDHLNRGVETWPRFSYYHYLQHHSFFLLMLIWNQYSYCCTVTPDYINCGSSCKSYHCSSSSASTSPPNTKKTQAFLSAGVLWVKVVKSALWRLVSGGEHLQLCLQIYILYLYSNWRHYAHFW